jgi:hypothetical protein
MAISPAEAAIPRKGLAAALDKAVAEAVEEIAAALRAWPEETNGGYYSVYLDRLESEFVRRLLAYPGLPHRTLAGRVAAEYVRAGWFVEIDDAWPQLLRLYP